MHGDEGFAQALISVMPTPSPQGFTWWKDNDNFLFIIFSILVDSYNNVNRRIQKRCKVSMRIRNCI
jgi:hypothetical protein